MSEEESIKSRDQVQTEDKWDVNVLFDSTEAWEKAYLESQQSKEYPHWPQIEAYRGKLNQGPKVLKEALDLIFSLSRKLELLYTYAHLKHDEDITFSKYKEAYQKISSTLYDFQQECSWLEPEILSLTDEQIKTYLASKELSDFKFHLERIIRMKPHTLSADKEELLAMAGKPMQVSSKAFSALNNADIKFGSVKDSSGKEHVLSHGLYQMYLRSPDRTLRENAFKTMHGKFLDYENTIGELLYGQIESHWFDARARKFKSSLEAALFPKNIPLSVYRSLIQAVRQGLSSLHRYVSLRKKVLKLDQLHLYDMYVPLVAKVDMKTDYKTAEELVIESVEPLGKEYRKILENGLKKEKWVDRFENKNKRSGAYSSGCFDSHPYILMNYKGILRDVFTLAHEAGHSMHSFYSNRSQPYHYARYPIFVAEVASTFNEELLMSLLLKKMDKKQERMFLINEKIEDIRATLFRQTMFAEFELKIHEMVENGQPLTPNLLKEMYYQLNCDYFGPEAVIDQEIAIEWARIPHFYYNFYVFQYATGISAALSLAQKVADQDENAKNQYISFLQGGSSLFPIDLLKLAGVDLSTSEPITQALKKFDTLVSQLEELIL